tara:strand:- start:6246 stop:7199 length:954 start_codon:yes stop_codon:yes gene_type:complete
MVTKQWAAIHRKHHAKCETSEDPHSPQVEGLAVVLWRGTELYRDAAKNTEICQKYGYGTPNDWLENNIYSKFVWHGVALMLIIDFILFGILGIAVWAIQMMWIPFLAAGVINGIGHYFGYRNFQTPDQSRNIFPIGVLIGGEELHNNHHSFATSPKLSIRWYEFDIGWFYIKILEFCGLAKTRNVPRRALYNPSKNSIDEDTVAAILASKYELFQKLHSAAKKIGAIYRKNCKKNSFGNSVELNKSAMEMRLANCLKEDFEKIWNERASSVDQVIEALNHWCVEAEKSGIKVLQDYSRKLHMLTLREFSYGSQNKSI